MSEMGDLLSIYSAFLKGKKRVNHESFGYPYFQTNPCVNGLVLLGKILTGNPWVFTIKF